MIRTTFENFDPDTGRASLDIGERRLGELEKARVVEWLVRFRSVDPIENVEAEPRIVLETRRQKRFVTTGIGRLYVHDPRNRLAPMIVMTPEEIIGEIDGSTALERSRLLAERCRRLVASRVFLPKPPPPDTPQRTRFQVALSVVALLLATYCLYPYFTIRAASPTAYEAITDPKLIESYSQELAGVYLTGNQPGHHGITIGVAGTLTLFQLNDRAEPSLLRDRYQFVRVDGQICLLGTLPGSLLRPLRNRTLSYAGEFYQRSR
ncbi:hypothetical protein [Horticoccus sp. 23ND18S-11]|uniref:hypothetical protein n=1 Tax=Horticoccus sp. 23ND18S-11 TaxID=3391832 RepID=UPI0039C983A4